MYIYETLNHIILCYRNKRICKFSRNEKNKRIVESLIKQYNKKNNYIWGE